MKCVILIDENLPLGLIANCASVLSLSLGKKVDGIIGYDLKDINNRTHLGITTMPIPILKSNKTQLKELREKLYDDKFNESIVVDFTNVAQRAKTYDDYAKLLSTTSQDEIEYLGVAIYGSKKLVNKLVGSIGLLK